MELSSDTSFILFIGLGLIALIILFSAVFIAFRLTKDKNKDEFDKKYGWMINILFVLIAVGVYVGLDALDIL